MAARRFAVAGLVAVGALAAAVVRPAVVETDGGSRLLVLLRGQSGRLRFVNSVTGRPVAIEFRVGTLFRDFAMRTDAATEEYYTNGTYPVNEVVSREATNVLRLCSIQGMHLTLGFHELDVRDGCLEVRLPWTRCSGGSCS